MKVDQVLDKINANRKSAGEPPILFETLKSEEIEEIIKIATSLEAKELTMDALKESIRNMRHQVELELTKEKMEKFSFWSFLFNFKNDYYLKARLRNYMLLEDLLITPENIRKHAEQQLSAMTGR